jgi:coenzyme PQQ precursor peptide PqqA
LREAGLQLLKLEWRHDKDVMSGFSEGANQPLAAFSRRASLGSEPHGKKTRSKGNVMAWTTPTLVEICIGLEINGYLPAEF